MDSEHIEVKEAWSTIRTIHELERLEEHVRDFLSHTLQTMSQPVTYPANWFHHSGDTSPENEREHPMGSFIPIIKHAMKGVMLRYGADLYAQAKLFDLRFDTKDDDG